MIVRSYHSHLPGHLSKKWRFGPTSRIQRNAWRLLWSFSMFAALQVYKVQSIALTHSFLHSCKLSIYTVF